MPRLPYPDPDKLTPQVRQMLEDRLPLNFFKMLGHAPSFMPGWFTLGRGILYEAELDPALRELAIIKVGSLCNCEYELHQHRRLAASIGLPAEKIAAATGDPGSSVFDKREQIVLLFAEQLVRQVKAEHDVFTAAVAELGQRQVMELMITVGFYMMAARIMENTEVDLEAGGGPSLEEARRLREKVKAKIAQSAAEEAARGG